VKLFLAPVMLFALAFPAAPQTPCGPPGVTATVTPAVASLGQVIQVTLTNNSSSEITLPSSCVFTGVFPDPACGGTAVALVPCPAVLTPIPPGGSFTQEWNQTDSFGQQVPPGTYSFDIFHSDGACCPAVTIAVPVPALPVPAVGALVVLAALAAIWVIRRR
jgi:hypothetical protein